MQQTREAEARRAALEAVLDSGVLGDQSRLRQLLTYLVTEEIEGRGDRLKAYNIATESLGRGPAFNPSTDSIVRVEVARLRQALALFSASAGSDVRLLIDIPKGGYRPEFLPNPAADCDEAPAEIVPQKATGGLQRPVTHILAAVLLVCLGALVGALIANQTGASAGVADSRPDRLRVELRPLGESQAVTDALLESQKVLSSFSQIRTVTRSLGDPETPTRWPESYRLTIAPAKDGGVWVDLMQSASGDVLSSQHFPGTRPGEAPADPMDYLTPLQAHVAGLVQREGEIDADYRSRGEVLPALHCMNLVYDYFPHQTDARHRAAVDCLEAELARDEAQAALHVGLSYMFREEYTDQRNLRPGDPVARALSEANRAAQLDPYGGINYYAQATVLNVMEQDESFYRAARTAVQLNPYSAEITGGIGARFALLGHSAEALIYLRRAEAVKPVEANWRNHAFFLAHFALGETASAIDRADLMLGSDNPLELAAFVIGRGLAEDRDGARKAFAQLMEITGGLDGMRGEYARRNYDPALRYKLMTALKAAADAS